MSTKAVFFSDILDTLRTCIAFGIFILDILDIQQLIYLGTFSWCSGSSTFFFGTFTQAPVLFFFRIFRTPPGHVLHLEYLFSIVWTLSTHLFVHALEVLHFFQDIYPSIRAVFFSLFSQFQHMSYIYLTHFRHLTPNLSVHILLKLWKFRIFQGHLPKHQG